MTEREFRSKYGDELRALKKTPFGRALFAMILKYLKPPIASPDELTRNGTLLAYMHQAHSQAEEFIGALSNIDDKKRDATGGDTEEKGPQKSMPVPTYLKPK